MRFIRKGLIGVGILGTLAACDGGTGAVLDLDATGEVTATAFLDRNGDGEMTLPVDQPASGLQVTLLQRGTSRVVGRGTTDQAGTFTLTDIPVGRYDVSVDNASLGDSLRVASVSPEELQIGAGATASIAVALDRRVIPISAARAIAAGRQVAVEGVALSAWNNFGDATIHIEDATGFLRAVRVPASEVVPGDRVRLTGTILLQDERVVLDQPAVTLLEGGLEPDARTLTAGEASTADEGALDGALARLGPARVLDVSAGPAGATIVLVEDTSGRIEVSFEAAADIETEFPLAPGVSIDVTGVLVPNGSSWRLRPRSSADVTVTLPTPTIAEFRALPAGTMVTLEGTAITSTANFNDGTVHLTDETGSVRVTGLTGTTIVAGDLVRFVGSVGTLNSQPVLVNSAIAPELLGRAAVPGPTSVNAGTARSARNGSLDAALVRVALVLVRDVETVGADRQVTVQDLSGSVDIIIDGDSGIPANALPQNSIVLGVTGVLVPAEGGRWHLKPRSTSDINR